MLSDVHADAREPRECVYVLICAQALSVVQLVRSYDFAFSFCIPNSQNSWEAVYDLPEVNEEEVPTTMVLRWS